MADDHVRKSESIHWLFPVSTKDQTTYKTSAGKYLLHHKLLSKPEFSSF